MPSAVPWANFAADPQHSGDSAVGAQPLDSIHWQASTDLAPSGFLHYGSPVITAKNTVIVPVKTGSSGGYELVAYNGATGAKKWTITTDYVLPPASWLPPYGPALTASGQLVFPGNDGTVYYVNSPDSNTASISGRLAFYNNTNYGSYSDVIIDTPITSDPAGNIYFGFMINGSNNGGIANGGVAKINAAGVGSFVQADVAAGDTNVTKVAYACAPALSLDGGTLYVTVNNSGNYYGYLLGLSTSTLATQAKVFLTDPRNGSGAGILDISTATPMVGPDGTVFYGIMGNPYNGSRGFMLHFSADLTQEYTPGAFGWDTTPSVVPTSMVPQYHGSSPYLIFLKYNNYVAAEVGSTGGSGNNEVAILDPYTSQPDTRNDGSSSLSVMNEVQVMPGPTPDTSYTGQGYPDAVREWCINDCVVDPHTKSILVNSEDGNIYRWDIVTNTLSQAVMADMGVGEPYTPTLIGPDGTVYAINGGSIFAMGGYSQYTITETSSLNPATVGKSITFATTMRAKGGGAVPTGSISYVDTINGSMTTLATVTLTNGVAKYSTSALSLGNHFIMAEYNPDSNSPNYSPGSTTLVESVRYGTTVSVTSSANPSISGQSVTFTATVRADVAGSGTPTGSVDFQDVTSGADLGSVALSGGTATLSVSSLAAGSHTIRAVYSGDGAFTLSQ
ncbi:MAG TPA: Ig-like domain-containing protein, partial [Gemmataceae bacterium]|nr:Ig-like domain-containing protein [Gemmataceae bacterium]